MKIFSAKILIRIFNIICLAVAVVLIIYWMYEFSLNKDVSSIDYKRYHESDDDQYPLLSLCFINFLSAKKLEQQNPRTNKSEYLNFIRGNYFEAQLLEIDFQNVSKNISNYIIGYYLIKEDGRKEYHGDKNLFDLSFVGKWWDKFITCYSLSPPQNSQFRIISILLNNAIFPQRRRNPEKGMFSVFHYPNQIILPGNPMKMSWPERERYHKFIMRYDVDNVAKIRRRNKPQQPCDTNWKNYDNAIIENNLKFVGCRLPFQNVHIRLPLCNTSQSMKKAWTNSPELAYAQNIQPCKSMIKIGYRFDETNTNGKLVDIFTLQLAFPNPFFREITLDR